MSQLATYVTVNAAHLVEALRTIGRWIRLGARRDAVTQTTSG